MSALDEHVRWLYELTQPEYGHEDIHLFRDRKRFFAVVHRLQPGVAEHLRETILPLYRPLFEAYLESSRALLPLDGDPPVDTARGKEQERWCRGQWILCWNAIKHATDPEPRRLQDLQSKLLEWATRWRLQDDWCLAAAVETLQVWALHPDQAPSPVHIYDFPLRGIRSPLGPDEIRFSFSDCGWQPALESWDDAARRIEEKFRLELGAYQKRMEEAYSTVGGQFMQVKRNRKGDHFEWLARYQVGRELWTEIRDQVNRRLAEQGATYRVSEDAVAKGAKNVAQRIKLTLAPPYREGRPQRSAS